MARVTSGRDVRLRSFGSVLAVLATTALVASPAALGAKDSVASGKLALKYSSGFQQQLKSNGVKLKLKPKSLKINGGKLDPTTGTGTVNLKGKLTFKKGSKKLVYKKLTARLGSGGYIKGSGGKVFKLKGGKVARNGFGANVTGVKLSFLKGAAKKVNKKLELDSLKKGKAGTASASNVQPSEVTLVSGTTQLTPNTTTLGKFPDHCVSPATGIAPVAPAAANTVTTPASFVFPITGGGIAPAGASGNASHSGGISITKTNNSGGCSGIPNTGAQLIQDQLTVGLTTKQIQAHNVISGAATPALDGDKGVAFIATLTGGTVTSDPATRKITISGATAAFNATAALVLNGLFPCVSGFDPNTGCTGPTAFVAGDPLGTITVTGQTQ